MIEEQCAEIVYSNEAWGSFHPHRCVKKVWKDIYCKIHHPESVKVRNKKAEEKWEEKRKNHPLILLRKANERIKELEIENEELKKKLRKIKGRIS